MLTSSYNVFAQHNLSVNTKYNDDGITFVFFTCDVESMAKGNPEKDIWGKVRNEYYGITKMMDILDKHGVKGTFFVNVYESPKFGEEELKKVCQEINKRGHDVELHTHPILSFPGIYRTQDAPLNKQIEIIREGKERIKKWIGKETVAHRSGGYAANQDTITACIRNGIKIDSSRNYTYARQQGLKNTEETMNAAEIYTDTTGTQGQLIEIPVTTYYQFKFGRFALPRIVDLEDASLAEFRTIFQAAANTKVKTIVIMSHSFSFSRYNSRTAQKLAQKMDHLFSYIKTVPSLELTTCEAYLNKNSILNSKVSNTNFIVTTGLIAAYLKSWERLEQGYKNILVEIAPVCFIMLLLIFFIHKGKCKKSNKKCF